MSKTLIPSQLERVPTGIDGLDRILNGGFIKGNVYLLWGDPGVGKTVLANQICCAYVGCGGKALYVTLLAESSAQMMKNISTLTFFDASVVPTSLSYVSAYAEFRNSLKDVLKLLSTELGTRQATMLIIDGVTIATVTSEPSEIKEFIHDLQTASEAYGCTSVLLANGGRRDFNPEHTMVDGLIRLHRTIYGTRSLREIEVLKQRGSGAIFGRHSFDISERGVAVFPRLETVLGNPRGEEVLKNDRISVGIPKLDRNLGGGIPGSSTTLLLGPSGTGKTTLGLHFISQSSREEPGLIFSFYESVPRLAMKAKTLSLAFEELIDNGVLDCMWFPPEVHLLDDLGAQLLDSVRRRKVKRLFIDGLEGFQRATPHADRIILFFSGLANELRILGVTTFYTVEAKAVMGPTVSTPVQGISLLAENLIVLRHVDLRARRCRLLSISKVRDSYFDASLYEFRITRNGIDISDTFLTPEAVLSAASTSNIDEKDGVAPASE